ncbi:MAG: NTP transferase domain-containing protein [Anaerohalosphaeraceae bacterium]|nr:NTP transferase domain-containing protein [Anaerohalosphaeraceae bacterium]
MKIIIPMAGHSRRFKQAGYERPKPFIMIDGRPVIELVCQMFSPEDKFIFICNKEHLANDEYLKILKSIVRNYQIIEIDPHEYGPTYSVLQAADYIGDENEPIIINYCDFLMQWNYRHFLLKAAQHDGAIPVFRGLHPASYGDTYYAYIKANEKLEMIELREKASFTNDRISEFASTGTYYIDSWKTFVIYANKLMETSLESNVEYYCSLLFNYMVRDGKNICLFEVDKFICLGTPSDIEEYIFWAEYFLKDVKTINNSYIYRARG